METGFEIAVIGMAGRFPGARNLKEFWHNLANGLETISVFTAEDMKDTNVPQEFLRHPKYIPAKGILEGIEFFDADFFNYSDGDAKAMDPQLRILHECVWEAIEDAGYTPDVNAKIGVYAGATDNLEWRAQIFLTGQNDAVIPFLHISNKDHTSTRIAYNLNLSGPSFTLDTQCSTSLVAIHLACQGLLGGECDMALAGGVSIFLPHKVGYIYREDFICSSDGHCRAFDEKADGTVFGDGVGMVLLKRLGDAIRDRDHIYAVIKGSAINNDGRKKLNYLAPSLEGQKEVISMALKLADVESGSISYVEAHGTGTYLGDAIEIEGLKRAFDGVQKGLCKIGTVKSNIGHVYTAAGVAGFIKTVLSLRHRQLPPSLHFRVANPRIDFEGSPFEVNTKLVPWEANGHPLRAGVSSFGVGGTNAHVVLEESPVLEPSGGSREVQMVMLSGRTAGVLERQTAQLVEYFARGEEMNLADVAYTLQVGRRGMSHRRVVWCRNRAEAMAGLLGEEGVASESREVGESRPQVVYMFTGQGSQYVEMGRGLYEQEEVYRRVAGECFERMREYTDLDLSGILYSGRGGGGRQIGIDETEASQPLLFVIEYGIAKQLEHWGIRPDAMIGHSIGEYVAATISGVLRLEDALRLVVLRGRLMQGCRRGVMLSVGQSGEVIKELLGEGLWLAAENSSELSVISGEEKAIGRLEEELSRRGLWSRRLRTSHAFHSGLMDEMLSSYREGLKGIQFGEPAVRYISNVTGDWVSRELVSKGDYWVRHVREGVRFSVGMSELLRGEGERILMEIGPGQSLSALVRQHAEYGSRHGVERVLRGDQESVSDWHYLLRSVGRLWLRGLEIDWGGYYSSERRRRVSLPTYPFERKRYWIDELTAQKRMEMLSQRNGSARKADIADWFYVPSWKRLNLYPKQEGGLASHSNCLIFLDRSRLGSTLAKKLRETYPQVVIAKSAGKFKKQRENVYQINPKHPEDYQRLFEDLLQLNRIPDAIVHLWTVSENHSDEFERAEFLKRVGFYSLLYIAQAFDKLRITSDARISVITSNTQNVTGEEVQSPEKAMILGPLKVIPQEHPNIHCCCIEIGLADFENRPDDWLIQQLHSEILQKSADKMVAYHNGFRWVQTFEPVKIEETVATPTKLRKAGVYLITGGLGNIGLVIAEYLASSLQSKLALIGRSPIPERESWQEWLAAHDEADSTSRKIRSILKIEEKGGEVLTMSADVANEENMRNALKQAEERFGPISGVIHAAGILNSKSAQSTVAEISDDDCEQQFNSKVLGTLVLAKILKDKPLDFCLLTSSLSSVLGGLGLVAYSAANAFMDSFVQSRNRYDSFPWIAINWDHWLLDDTDSNHLVGIDEGAMNAQEGAQTFERILSLQDENQVIVSTRDLQVRINQWVKLITRDTNGAARDADTTTRASRPHLNTAFVAPRNQVENLMCKIWQDLFRVEEIGINDNFFELGGDSLRAVKLVSKIHKELNVKLPLTQLFESPTIKKLTEYVSNSRIESIELTKPAEAKEFYDLSSAQKRMYFLQQVVKDGIMYNIPIAVALEGEIEKKRLARTLKHLIGRYESLRTSFHIVNDKPVQKIAESLDLQISHFRAQLSEVENIIRGFIRPFDLTQAPLFRVGLIEVSAKEHFLVIDIHHIIADEASIYILIEDLLRLYGGQKLPDLTLQYKDFSEWQNREKNTERMAKQKEYWLNQFGNGIPPLNLRADYPRPAIMNFTGNRLVLEIERADTEALKIFALEEGATIYMVLLACVNILLAKISDQEDITIGTPVLGRNHKDSTDLIGMFTNTLALRNFPNKEKQFVEFLNDVKTRTLDALANQDYQFEDLVDALALNRAINQNPLFNIMFALRRRRATLGDVMTEEIREEIKLKRYDFILNTSICDLLFIGEELDDKIIFEIHYSIELFKRDTVERFINYFKDLIKAVLQNKSVRLRDIKFTHHLIDVKAYAAEKEQGDFLF